MSRAAFGSLVAAALAIALASRVSGLDLRPMHHDEANQAVKFGMLLETGEYRYDKNDHHGPTLYYLTLPAAWIRGQTTLAALDERTLRAVPAMFGVGLILLFLPLAAGLGRPAVAASALLAAISPALTYYSRFYIQEPLLAFFALAFLIALGRYVQRPGMTMAAGAGACAGLAYATKETSVIVVFAALGAALLARLPWGQIAPWRPSTAAPRRESIFSARAADAAVGLAAALATSFVFYSSFFRQPAGFLESIRAFSIYVERGVGPGAHTEPWDYYVRLLSFSSSGGLVWTEGLVLALALVGTVAAARRSSTGYWPRLVALYSWIAALAFSVVRYKTPWNLLPFYVGFVLMGGIGAAVLIGGARPRVLRALMVMILFGAVCHLGLQNWRANARYPADARNPYAYAQTSPDLLRLAQRIADVSAFHPDRMQMLVKVVAGPYEQWPLPWYLRRMPRVGYWVRAGEAGSLDGVPVIVASQDNTGDVGAALGDRYVSEFYGLRPDVLLTLYIERGLWERFLGSRGPGT
jgi:uncharacterized protein (TIGR03663 family)